MILLADNERSDQTAHPRSLIRAFDVRQWHESTFSLGGVSSYPKRDCVDPDLDLVFLVAQEASKRFIMWIVQG